MKDVLKYELKRNLLFFPILLGLGLSIYLFILWGSFYISVNSFTSFVGYFSFVGIILIIYYNFSYNKKRISLDLYYALPITHKELFLGKYLFTLIEVVVMFLVLLGSSYAIAGLLSLGISFAGEPMYLTRSELLQIFYIVLIELVSGLGLMNVILFFFNRANNYIDSILYLIFLIFIPKIVVLIISYFINERLLDYSLYAMLGNWCNYYILNTKDTVYVLNLVLGLSITVICYLSFIPLYFYSTKTYAEKVELPDTKLFSYKLLTPILFILVLIYFSAIINHNPFNLLLIGVVLVLEYSTYAIFSRTIKISKLDIIMMAITLVLGVILMFVINIE